jgi:GAF domain-containing protein/DNA-binding response OmpR family regulator
MPEEEKAPSMLERPNQRTEGSKAAQTHSDEERRTVRMRWMIIVGIVCVVALLATDVTAYLETRLWHVLVDASGLVLAIVCLAVAFWLVRRQELDKAGYLMLLAVFLGYASGELVWSGETWFNLLSAILLILVVGTMALRRRWTAWLIAIAAYLIWTLLVFRFEPLSRYRMIDAYGGLLIVNLGLTTVLILALLVQVWRTFRRGAIRTQLTIAFVVVVLMPVIALTAASGTAIYFGQRQQILDQLRSVATLKAGEIGTWLQSLKSELVTTPTEQDLTGARTLLTTRSTAPSYRRAFGDLADRLEFLRARSVYFQELFLMNVDGQVILSTDAAHEGNVYSSGLTYRSRTAFEEDPEGPHVTPPLYYNVLGEMALIVTRPMVGEQGQLLGFLCGRTSLDTLDTIMLERSGLGTTGETYLVGLNSALLSGARSGEEGITVETEAANAAIADRAGGFGFYENHRGLTVVGVYEWLPELQVALLAEQEQAEALTVVYVLIGANSAVAIIGILAAVGISLLATRRLTRSLANLAETAVHIAAGDLAQVAQVERDDEIGALAQAFNQMTTQLRNLIGTLEQRVAERTRDLERRSAQLETASQVAREAAGVRDVDVLLDDTVRLISERFSFYHVGVFLLDDAREYAVLRATNSEGGRRMLARGHRLKVGQLGIVGYVTDSGNPRIAADVGADAVFFDNPDLPLTRSEMALPLKVAERIIGALDVQSTEEAAFSAEDIAVLSTLADQVATAIENSRLLAQTQSALAEVETLHRQYLQGQWVRATTTRGPLTYEYTRVGSSSRVSTPQVDQALQRGDTVVLHDPDDDGSADGALKSGLAVPIKLRGQVIGVIDVQETEEERHWTGEEINFVESVSDQMAQALENVRLIEETRSRAEELAVLNELSRSLSAALSVQEVLEKTHQGVSRLLDTSNFYIALYHPDRELISIPINVTALEDDGHVEVIPMGKGLTGQVIQSRESLLLRGNVRDYLKDMGIDVIGEVAQCWLGVPMVIGEQVLGIIAVQNYVIPHAYDEHDQNLLLAIASQTAIALQNARLFEETQQALAETETLYNASRRISAADDLAEIVAAVAEEVPVPAINRATLWATETDAAGQEEALVSTANWYSGEGTNPLPLGTRFPIKQFPAIRLALAQEPLAFSDVVSDDRVDPVTRAVFEQQNAHALALLPLWLGRRHLGVLMIVGEQPYTFTEREMRPYRALARQTAVAIESQRLFEQTEAALAETATLYRASRTLGEATTIDGFVLGTAEVAASLQFTGCTLTLVTATGDQGVPVRGDVYAARHDGDEWLTVPPQFDLPIVDQTASERVLEEPEFVLVHADAETLRTALPEEVRRSMDGAQMQGMVTTGLSARGQPLGFLSFMGPASLAEFSQDQARRMRTVADQVTVAIENLRLVEETSRRATQLGTAAEVSSAASSILSLDELLPQAAELIRRRFDYYYVGIFLVDASGRWSVLRAGTGEAGRQMREDGHRLEVGGSSMIGQCAALGEARIAFDVGSEAVRFENPLLPATRSEMALPLMSRGHVIGAMSIQSARSAAFSEEDITVLQTMADQLANAIENARLFSETQESLEETRELYEASQKIGAASAPMEVEGMLVDYVAHSGLDVARVLLYEFTDDDPTHIVMSSGWTIDERPVHPPGTRLAATEFALSQFIRASEVFTVENIHSHPELDQATRMIIEVLRLQSFAIVPLTVGRREIGGLLIGRDAPGPFPEKLLRNLSTLCSQAAVSIENLRLLEETQRRALELEALNEVARAIASILDPAVLLREIADITKTRFGHDYVGVLMVNGDQLALEGGSTVGDTEHRLQAPQMAFDLHRPGITTDAARTSQPVLVNDVLSDARYITVPELSEARSELAVPVEVKGRVIGVLDVMRNRPQAYSQTDVILMQSLASQAGVAIENARLFEETQAEAGRRALINEVMQAAARSLHPADLLHETGEAISRRLQTPSALFTWDPVEQVLYPVAVHNDAAADVLLPEGTRITRDMNPLLFEAVESGRTRILETCADLSGPPAELARQLDIQSAVYVPLTYRDQVLGILDLSQVKGRPLGPEEVGFANIIAGNLSVALENARLYQEAVETAERLAEVDRLKSQFLANMSHELRTPLNSIIGFSRVILKGIDGPLTDLQKQDLNAIYNSGQHLLSLINDILNISKIEAGKMELSFEPVEVAELVASVLSTAIALVKDKGVELQQDVADSMPVITADNRRLRQVLLNLVANAAKFTEEGFIKVIARANDQFVTITVQDSGIGIPEDKLGTIFEAFTQVDGSATRKVGGTGLGLTIARSLVELHGGKMWVESQLEVGSAFHFTLPIGGPEAIVEEEDAEEEPKATQQRVERPAAPAEETREGGASKVVLCVDDDEGVLTLFKRYLSKQGYQVVGLTDSRRVLDEARRLQPDAITLDVMMPEIDGWQIIQKLKDDPQTRHIPIVMCTIVSEKGRGMSLGAADYLVKPILEQDLLDALDRLDREAGHHRVLVVDDLPEHRKLLRRMIESQPGYEVVEATSGKEAMASVQRVAPHIIVLDLMMPEMDGFAVLEALKRDENTRSIPIIVVTAKELTAEDRDRLNSHTEALIQKGVLNERELLNDVTAALKKLDRSRAPSKGTDGT